MKIEGFVKDLLEDRGINEKDKEELKYEITDHLIMLKQEFLGKGLDEEASEKAAIKSFGDSNLIGNYIKTNLPSHNKYDDLSLEKKINCIILMFLGLVSCIFIKYIFNGYSYSDSLEANIISIFTAFMVTAISFLYVNIKISNVKNRVKNIVMLNISFFMFDFVFKIALNMILAFRYSDFTFELKNLFNPRMHIVSMTFSIAYIVTFVVLTVLSVFIIKQFSEKLFRKTRNINDSKTKEVLKWLISLSLTMGYFTTVSQPWRIYRIIYFLNRDKVGIMEIIEDNILYIAFDNGIVIINIGLILLIVLLAKLAVKIKKKGLRSVF